jgi:hypothetical protein
MPVIIAFFAPGGAGRVFATVDAPLDVGALAEHVGILQPIHSLELSQLGRLQKKLNDA